MVYFSGEFDESSESDSSETKYLFPSCKNDNEIVIFLSSQFVIPPIYQTPSFSRAVTIYSPIFPYRIIV